MKYRLLNGRSVIQKATVVVVWSPVREAAVLDLEKVNVGYIFQMMRCTIDYTWCTIKRNRQLGRRRDSSYEKVF